MLREVIANESYTLLFVLCIALLALAKFWYNTRFNDFLSVLVNWKYLKIYARDQKFVDQFDGLLYGNFIISATIFSLISYGVLIEPIAFDWYLFVKILIGIGAVIIIKVLLERLVGSLFDIDELIDQYLFQKSNYKNYLGLILLPMNIVFIYTLSPSKTIIYIAIAALFVVNLTGIASTFKNYQGIILGNLFYFILYLCALEFGPYIVLYKLLRMNQ